MGVMKDPAGVVRDCYEFLGVDPTFQPTRLGKPFNADPERGRDEEIAIARDVLGPFFQRENELLFALIDREFPEWDAVISSQEQGS